MAFIDNPTISALGSAIGLKPLFDEAGGNTPSAPQIPTGEASQQQPYELAQNITPPPLRGRSAAPVPEYKSRPYLPHAIGTVGGVRPGAQVSGSNPIIPGNMDPATLQSPEVQNLLKQYGVSAPNTPPDPNLFIHNPEAFQKHPLAAGLLERGLEGVAYAHPGQNWLDSLVGGVRGMQEANAARGAQANAQTMAPLNQAAVIQNLTGTAQKQSDEHQKMLDDQQYHIGLLAHYHAADTTKKERMASMPPHYNPKTGQPSYPEEDDDGNIQYKPDKTWQEDPRTAITRAIYNRTTSALKTQYPSDDPDDPYKNVPPKELEDTFNSITSHEAIAAEAGKQKIADTRANATTGAASIRAGASHGGSNAPGQVTPQARLELQQLNRDNAEHARALTPKDGYVTDTSGAHVLADPNNDEYKQHIAKHSAAIQANKARISTILNGSGSPQSSGPPQVTPPANANPFRR